MKVQLPPNGRLTIEFEGHTTVIAVTFDKKNDKIVVQSDLLGTLYTESLEGELLELDPAKALRMRLFDLPFESRALYFFERNDLRTVEELIKYSKRQLMSFPHIGRTTADHIEAVLRRVQMKLKE
jgi:DNA-directed RNA polymerase alpha subunit